MREIGGTIPSYRRAMAGGFDCPSFKEPRMTTTSGSAKWQGGIKDGKGAISTKSGALNDYPYGFASRFEGKPGSNPEDLIGAAHAACFTMALSLILGDAKLTAEKMETQPTSRSRSRPTASPSHPCI